MMSSQSAEPHASSCTGAGETSSRAATRILATVASARFVALLAGAALAAALMPTTAQAVPLAWLVICKDAAPVDPATGSFTFTVAQSPYLATTVAVPVGDCSPKIGLDVSYEDVTVTELSTPTTRLAALTVSPDPNFGTFYAPAVSYSLVTRTAILADPPPGVTTLRFVNSLDRGDVQAPRGPGPKSVPPGRLKVCKVAGPGVAVGRSFSFNAAAPDEYPAPAPFTVLSGMGPRGVCTFGPAFPDGSIVRVQENVPAGIVVSDITVNPPVRLVATPDRFGGFVDVAIGSGITEVTFTDSARRARPGWFEICVYDRARNKGDLHAVDESLIVRDRTRALGTIVVPVGSCSSAIEVAAGDITIRRARRAGTKLVACRTVPSKKQVRCNRSRQTSTVKVSPGDASKQSVAILTIR